MNAFETAMAFTVGYGVPGFGEEGAVANNPADPGGYTFRGITLRAYRAWLGDPTAAPVQLNAISEDDLLAFYAAGYWRPVNGDALPPGVGLSVFDMAVNAGVRASAKLLQKAVGTVQDGDIGPATLAAVAKLTPLFLIGRLGVLQLAYYRALPGFPTFGRGWTGRVCRRETAAEAAFNTAHLP